MSKAASGEQTKTAQSQTDVVVVGGGIAGLTAAFRLQQQGLSVTVLEAEDVVGGKMVSVERDGYVLNKGATLIPGGNARLTALTADAGLGHPFADLPFSVGIPRDGRIRVLGTSGIRELLKTARTDLLSWRSKFLLRRLAVDLVRWQRRLAGDYTFEKAAWYDTETVHSYARRRLNKEIYDYVLDPVLRGVGLSDTAQMSVVDLFLTLGKFIQGGPMQYPTGIDFLAKRLATFVDVRTGATVTSVRHAGDGVETAWRDGEGEHTIRSRGAVVTVYGPDLLEIYADLTDRQRELVATVRYKSVLKATFALRRLPVDLPTIVPLSNVSGIGLGIIVVDTHLMPGSAPVGKAVISGHWVDEYSKANMHRSDEELLPEFIRHMETVVPGLSDEIEFAEITRWQLATNARYQGFYPVAAELRRTQDPDDVIQLAGDYLGLSGAGMSIGNGERAAAMLGKRLQG